VRSAPHGFRLQALLAEMKIEIDAQAADLERVPIKGPLVAVANHPFGVLDGAALAVLLSRVRPDVKILANSSLESIPELHEHCIFVDVFHPSPSMNKNVTPLKHALEWLRQGGALAVFPAGEVAMECKPGAGYRSSMEHRRNSPDKRDSGQSAPGIFLRPQ